MAAADNQPVLIAYDGSEFAAAAIREAGAQLGPGRTAIVATVFEPLDKLPFLGVGGVPIESDTMTEIYENAEQGARHTAEQGAELARQVGFDAEPLVSAGNPVWDRIVGLAEERDAGLIVIGSRGLSGVKHALLGSVAAAVAQHSKRSVLIVHHR